MPHATHTISIGRFTKLAFGVWALSVMIGLGARVLGPSDLGQNLDQSKTIAFTLDMVEHHEWVLPRDSLGERTHKPPMVNWVGVPIVALGFHNELALKLPAVLSGVSITIMTFFGARLLLRRLTAHGVDALDEQIGELATPLAALAAGAWFASPSAIKHIYFMRPDILFTALLIGAWLAALKLLSDEPTTRPRTLALSIWVLTALAILTKGPLAVFVPIYIGAHLLLITPKGSRRDAMERLCLWRGVLIVLIVPGLWLGAAYRVDPEHVRSVLFGQELGDRLANSGVWATLNSIIATPGYFIERFLPWCIPAGLAMLFRPSSRLRIHPMGPAVLWVWVILLTTGLSSISAGSYIMPAFPAAAMLAVYVLFRLIATKRVLRIRGAVWAIATVIIVSASLIGLREATMSRGARDQSGEHIKSFGAQASTRVGTGSVRFNAMGDLPVGSLMGRHQAGDLGSAPSAQWIIEPISMHQDTYPETLPVLVSEPITAHDPDTGEPTDETITIGLYRSTED